MASAMTMGARYDDFEGGGGPPHYAGEVRRPTEDSRVGVLAELRMSHVTLRQLHSEAQGSLSRFLLELRTELARLAHISDRRVSILGIHERYKRSFDGLSGNGKKEQHPTNKHDQEVVVRFEVMPGDGADSVEAVKGIDRRLISGERLGRPGSPVGPALRNATVALGLSSGLGAQAAARLAEQRGMERLGVMALPIGISAVFTGAIVWLAAW